MSWLEEARARVKANSFYSSASIKGGLRDELGRALDIIERFIATTEGERCPMPGYSALSEPTACGECAACRRRALVEEVRD